MSLDDSINDDDEQIVMDGLTILVDKNFYNSVGGKLKIDFAEDQGITVELLK